jgi:hypothetical protein
VLRRRSQGPTMGSNAISSSSTLQACEGTVLYAACLLTIRAAVQKPMEGPKPDQRRSEGCYCTLHSRTERGGIQLLTPQNLNCQKTQRMVLATIVRNRSRKGKCQIVAARRAHTFLRMAQRKTREGWHQLMIANPWKER